MEKAAGLRGVFDPPRGGPEARAASRPELTAPAFFFPLPGSKSNCEEVV